MVWLVIAGVFAWTFGLFGVSLLLPRLCLCIRAVQGKHEPDPRGLGHLVQTAILSYVSRYVSLLLALVALIVRYLL